MSSSSHATSSSRRRAGGPALLAAALTAAVVALRPGGLEGQDSVSGHWLASVQGDRGSPEVVFVLQLNGGSISGRRILPGQQALDVRGDQQGSRVRLEFRVPEGSSSVEVRIEAQARADRMDGTWTAILPSGQRVERPWVAQRTRSGNLLNRDGPGPGR
ncbi:MAG TPA: hypothetical protein VK858_20035 [Longimicrobiales bacterium]|nr:hypothetical protein [Longimicrobiales bacterium]